MNIARLITAALVLGTAGGSAIAATVVYIEGRGDIVAGFERDAEKSVNHRSPGFRMKKPGKRHLALFTPPKLNGRPKSISRQLSSGASLGLVKFASGRGGNKAPLSGNGDARRFDQRISANPLPKSLVQTASLPEPLTADQNALVPVPLPATLPLLLAGLAGLGFWRRKKA